jgi:hypothetical protein
MMILGGIVLFLLGIWFLDSVWKMPSRWTPSDPETYHE